MRITHLPTGIVVECQDDRSQHRNKAQAMAVLAARLTTSERRERQRKEAATRKSLIGSGDRSERIRTYNFPQGRVTDHRINLTLYKIDTIMDGDLDELIAALGAGAPGRAAGRARRSRTEGGGSRASACSTPSALRLARVPCRGYAEQLYRLDSDPRVMRYIGDGSVGTRASVAGSVARAMKYYRVYPGLGVWPAEVRATGAFIGWFCLKYVPATVEVEVGYRLLPRRGDAATRPRARGRWCATDSPIWVCIGSSASRIPTTSRRSACC